MSALWPTGSTSQPPIVSPYGYRLNPVTHVWSLHAGADIAASGGLRAGSPQYAAEAGTIIYSGISGSLSSGYGVLVVIRTSSGRHYVYAHLQQGSNRGLGTVGRGDVIGRTGTTGGSTGPHSHFGTGRGGWSYAQLVDPVGFMAQLNAGVAGGGFDPITQEEPEMHKIIAPYGLPDRGAIAPGHGIAFANEGLFSHYLNVWGLGTPQTVPITIVGGPTWNAKQNRDVFNLLIDMHKDAGAPRPGAPAPTVAQIVAAIKPLVADSGVDLELTDAQLELIGKQISDAVEIPLEFTIAGTAKAAG